ncbi:hypothetical protein BC835DRAFT_1305265 [Cytidiella melzeri]|nr:hypothetical protein BC835DRAFT_1305265 [Cytidiella melzeri]
MFTCISRNLISCGLIVDQTKVNIGHTGCSSLNALMSVFDNLFCANKRLPLDTTVASSLLFPPLSLTYHPASTSKTNNGLNHVPQLSQSDGTGSTSSFSTGPFPVGSIRSCCCDSSPDMGPERKKQMLLFVCSRCLEYQLEETAADYFSQLDADQRSIETYILVKARFLSKTMEALQSKSYKVHVQDQVLVVMMSPNIPAYLKNTVNIVMSALSGLSSTVQPCTNGKMEDYSDNHQQRDDPSLIGHQGHSSLISSTDKLKPCTGAQDIIAMVNKIALEYINTDCSHYTRFAFLRQCYLKHHQVQANATEGTNTANAHAKKDDSFWKYVNDKLQKATIQTKVKSTSDAQAAVLLKEYFDLCLKADLRLFTICNGALPSGPANLLPIQRAVNKFMGSVVV